jgi:hypothetical protein
MVIFPVIECGYGSIDDDCGCRRSMAGLVSRRATTTVEVVGRRGLDPETYFTIVSDGIRDQGYVTEEMMKDHEVSSWLRHLTHELMHIAGSFPVGTVLERRGDLLSVRRDIEQAAG